ncbi:MAG: Gfo/Idh/MocA family oxidoreductase [Defluviitaleaceae bacterium]|nr:Gfo/Idh/MocA family oxidoreductase [Defluviitaleaceae bacterium]
MKKIKVGVIGIGGWGWSYIHRLCEMMCEQEARLPDKQEAGFHVELAAVCDLRVEMAEYAANFTREKTGFSPVVCSCADKFFCGAGLDAAVITTSWQTHIPLAVKAMKNGVRPGIEAGGASSVERCHELVAAYEETGVPCMFMENFNYERSEMALLNMTERGMFGELVHVQCGYQHDLRDNLANCRANHNYRLEHYLHRNGDFYPMHGLGPKLKLLKIFNGNRFTSLVSMSSKARGLAAWVKGNLPEGHHMHKENITEGDIVVTLIKCENGETVQLIHDTTLPRPFSRNGRVQGTKGIWMADTKSVYIEGMSPPGKWEDFTEFIERNDLDHPVWKEYLASGRADSVAHGAIDYLVLREFLRSAAEHTDPPVNTYEAALLSAVTPLSEQSIALGSQPVNVPDFTHGKYMS